MSGWTPREKAETIEEKYRAANKLKKTPENEMNGWIIACTFPGNEDEF